ncbi:capsid protein P80 [Adoxophyes honmai nucleopolyhedrovirus]|uniref:Capsid protein P80 n=1 Tax=Adoxophyes honmai nucleopolyhedrovirus TaxID=224399 RepID=Q80LL6_NPVAH|nr:capsid protein P80 [Adoxophyes honmai nucleopolyhedrovirus]BAC67331.1 capsid protein P80 [Adoxophyes honmai nucleopolyhedrovirus]
MEELISVAGGNEGETPSNLIVYNIEGNGACLFGAIAHLRYSDQLLHRRVRQEIVNYITQNWERFRNYTCNKELNAYRTMEEYQADMLKPETFGSMTELHAASELYSFRFVVFKDTRVYTTVGKQCYPVKHLLFSGDISSGHFDVLENRFKENTSRLDLMLKKNMDLVTENSTLNDYMQVEDLDGILQTLPLSDESNTVNEKYAVARIGFCIGVDSESILINTLLIVNDYLNTNFNNYTEELERQFNTDPYKIQMALENKENLIVNFNTIVHMWVQYKIIKNIVTDVELTDLINVLDIEYDNDVTLTNDKSPEKPKRKRRARLHRSEIEKRLRPLSPTETELKYSPALSISSASETEMPVSSTIVMQPLIEVDQNDANTGFEIDDKVHVPLPVSMPLYLQSLIVHMSLDFTKTYVTCPTKDLSIVPDRSNFYNSISVLKQINKSILTQHIHFYEMLQPLLYYAGNKSGEIYVAWFISASGSYFIKCAHQFNSVRRNFSDENDADRIVLFIYLYNFLWHYRSFLKHLKDFKATSNHNPNLTSLLKLYSENVRKAFVKINFDLDNTELYVTNIPTIVYLMTGKTVS